MVLLLIHRRRIQNRFLNLFTEDGEGVFTYRQLLLDLTLVDCIKKDPTSGRKNGVLRSLV
uniref:Uncharacterized protein n=1 Tax=Peronospora matthiolae TaxID=2874970 RepID=A0AAV1ULX3_9STRA